MKPIIGITMGDPSGIGPELLLKTLSKPAIRKRFHCIVFGDYSYLNRVHTYLHRKGKIGPFRYEQVPLSIYKKHAYVGKTVPVIDFNLLSQRPVTFGRSSAWAGYASGCYIKAAVDAALAKQIDALVTLPINKKSFALGGWGGKYRGHTEMLSALTKTKEAALMLVSNQVRAVHVTQHVPLKDVARLITTPRVRSTIELAYHGLRALGITRPRIAVCGLNPHAGDSGVLGTEELKIIRPVVVSLRARGWNVQGPFSADTVWPLVEERKFDVGVAMYHDQGQIPVKMMGRDAINVTLGLPIIRTSVGHGTGFDIAGQGTADPQSFEEAIYFAGRMAEKSRGRN